MTHLEKVLAETRRYEHALLDFSAREQNGGIELVIELKDKGLGLHTYYAPVHARDIEHVQFPWTFQRYLYDCMHDYLVEMFTLHAAEPGPATMTPAGELLAAEIRTAGPVSFHRFMEVALYDPAHGYYRRAADPFGKDGDFFTAEQIQPVFGILVAARIRELFHAMGAPPEFTVVEPGAGRREMAEALAEWKYVPVDIDSGKLPEHFAGVVFSNEFFDALPVDAVVYTDHAFREQRVGMENGAFYWQTGEVVGEESDEYLRRYYPAPEEGRWYEVNLEALRWMDRIAAALTKGYVLTIDYGFTRAESVRFAAGTLMGYRRHTAREDVLTDPGARDITAHVNFTALQEYGAECGLVSERFETLAQTLLATGERDQFASALGVAGTGEEFRRRMQLKTLLFGMGETFHVLLQKKVGGK